MSAENTTNDEMKKSEKLSPVDPAQVQMEEILSQFPTYRDQNKFSFSLTISAKKL